MQLHRENTNRKWKLPACDGVPQFCTSEGLREFEAAFPSRLRLSPIQKCEYLMEAGIEAGQGAYPWANHVLRSRMTVAKE